MNSTINGRQRILIPFSQLETDSSSSEKNIPNTQKLLYYFLILKREVQLLLIAPNFRLPILNEL